MRVFKYRGGDRKTFERDLEALERNYYWGANFDQLNDPCETLISSIRFKKLTKTFVKFLNSNIQSELDKVHEALDKVIDHGKTIGIYSLSETYNDELLWAHYANSHKGFCIEYDLNLLIESYPTDKVYSFPVKYSKTPPEINISDISNREGNSFIKKLAGNKSIRWKYEAEHRIITEKSGKHGYNFEAVKAIYFGLRMSEEWKEELMNRLKGRGIEYFQMRQVEGQYLFTHELVQDKNGSEKVYLSQIPKSENRKLPVKYKITEKDYNRFLGKATATVQLETTIDKDELSWIAHTLKDHLFSNAERIFIAYFVVGQLDEDMAWATTNFDGDQLNVFINEYVRLP